jgi:hypothetical protein
MQHTPDAKTPALGRRSRDHWHVVTEPALRSIDAQSRSPRPSRLALGRSCPQPLPDGNG